MNTDVFLLREQEGIGFESQLDPGFFSVDLFLALSVKNICTVYSSLLTGAFWYRRTI